jgi:catalase
MQGIANLTNAEAAQIVATDREYSQRDLFENIEKGNFPKWKMCVQIMPEAEAKTYRYNPFDLTKVWSQKDYPLIEVGMMELNKNPENYFAEVEQSAFDPGNVVPGIGFSPDKMLQGRLFAYADAARYRIGANYECLPVNAPRCPMHNYQRDGAMRFDGNGGGSHNYEPSSFGGPVQYAGAQEPSLDLDGSAFNFNHREDKDYYSQPGDLFRLIPKDEQQRLMQNVAEAMDGVPDNIRLRAVARFYQADKDCGIGIAKNLKLDEKAVLAEVERQKGE